MDDGDQTLTITIALDNDAPEGVALGVATAAVTVRDDDDVPAAPTDVAAVAMVGSNTDVELSWTASPDAGRLDGAAATVLRYEYDIDGAGNWRDAGLASPFTVSGLDTAANSYALRLRAVNPVGAGPAADAAYAAVTLTPVVQLPAVGYSPRVNEGEAATFRLSLRNGPAADVAITWAAAGSGDNPATPGDDFAASGAATLTAGSKLAEFHVATVADAVAESDETFTVSIVFGGVSLPGGAVTIADVPAGAPGAPSAPTDYRALEAVDSGGVSLLWGMPADPGVVDGEPALVTGFEYQVDAGPWQPTTPGALGHVIPGLSSTAGHKFRLRALNVAGAGTPTPPFGVDRVAFAHGGGTDYDTDDDHLIEISNLEQLAAVSHNLYADGRTLIYSNTAFTSPRHFMGCKDHVCHGYELTRDLDFLDPDSYQSGQVNHDWTANAQWRGGGKGWTPIGRFNGRSVGYFETNFEGNGKTISNLYIYRNTRDFLGLFTAIGERGNVRNLGLFGVSIQGQTGAYQYAGAVAGFNHGRIQRVWVTGDVKGSREVGGIAGGNRGEIINSYSHAYVEGSTYQVGGLAGRNEKDALIKSSYATGFVGGSATDVGGLVGLHKGKQGRRYVHVENSYATGKVTGNRRGGLMGGGSDHSRQLNSYFDYQTAGFSAGDRFAKSSHELRWSDASHSIFEDWDRNPVYDPWDFGTRTEYPVLKVDFNGDGRSTWEEFGYQRPGLAFSRKDIALNEGESSQYTLHLTMPPRRDETVTVIISPAGDDADLVNLRQGGVNVSVARLSFNRHNWRQPQTITVASLQDDDAQDETVTLLNLVASNRARAGGHYRDYCRDINTLADAGCVVNVAVTDDEEPSLIVSPATLRMFAGESQSYTVKLSEPPAADVTVLVGRDDPENVATITAHGRSAPNGQIYLDFTPQNWNQAQTVTVSGQLITGANAPTYPARRTLTHTVHQAGPDYAGAAAVTVGVTVLARPTGGLIPIRDLEELNAVRWDLDGNGQADDPANDTTYKAAFSEDDLECAPACSGYELLTDLDFKDPTSYASGQVNTAWTSGAGWEPIGAANNKQFKADFHGGGHTISNLFIDRSGSTGNSNGIGLFGAVGKSGAPANILNLGLERAIVKGPNRLGALTGVLQFKSKITNSYVANGSRVIGGSTEDTDIHIGGLVGIVVDATVENSYARLDELYGASNVGGLVGTMQNSSSIIGSYASSAGDCPRSGIFSGTEEVGGLVGHVDGSTVQGSHAALCIVEGRSQVGGLAGKVINSSTITDSHASFVGLLKPFKEEGGGLVGRLEDSTVKRSYAAVGIAVGGSGAGHGASNFNYAGGLVGIATGSDIISSYASVSIATANVIGTPYTANYLGGLVGSHEVEEGGGGGGIIASYATGRIAIFGSGVMFGDAVGGLVGYLKAE